MLKINESASYRYIDSSQDQEWLNEQTQKCQQYQFKKFKKKSTPKYLENNLPNRKFKAAASGIEIKQHVGHVFEDSSEQQQQTQKQTQTYRQQQQQGQQNIDDMNCLNFQTNQYEQKQHNDKKSKGNNCKSKKLCKMNSDAYLLSNNHIDRLEEIVKQSKQQLTKKVPLLIQNGDKLILENMKMRADNYGYFLRTLDIDRKYQQIMQEKARKIRAANQKKKLILDKKKALTSIEQDEKQLRRYVLDKKMKEDIVIDRVEKYAYKLGIQRIRKEEKQIKHKTKGIQSKAMLKMSNLQIRQKNKIDQLREQLQQARQATKVNKIDQAKALKQMQQQISKQKKFLLMKADGPNKKFKV